MTLKECIAATISMPAYTKFWHPRFFSKGEYIYRDARGWLKDECGYNLIEEEFWAIRLKNPHLADGWEIIK